MMTSKAHEKTNPGKGPIQMQRERGPMRRKKGMSEHKGPSAADLAEGTLSKGWRNGYRTRPYAQKMCTAFSMSPIGKGPIQIQTLHRYHENAKQHTPIH